MRVYDFDECVLLDNKNKNTVKIEPQYISVGISMDGCSEVEIQGVLRDYEWKSNNFRLEPVHKKVDFRKMYGAMFWEMPKIKNVKYNDPATIVFWADGTKTVVKCQDGDIFDPEKGLVMATTKKALGNNGNYYNELKKWLPKDKGATLEYVLNASSTSINDIGKSIVEAVNKSLKQLEIERNK